MGKVKIIISIAFFIISFALFITGILLHIFTAESIPSDDFSQTSTILMVSGCVAIIISVVFSLLHLNSKNKGAKK